MSGNQISPLYLKEKQPDLDLLHFSRWNTYSYVVAKQPTTGKPFMWGVGQGLPDTNLESVGPLIDGQAATFITSWDGEVSSLD